MRILRFFALREGLGRRKKHCSALSWDVLIMTTREIGGKIRQCRKRLGLRQRDLAEIAGVTLRGLTDLENGRANPTLNQLSKILEVLGLEVRVVER
jgi:y4mF family transcriptional regulator